MTLITKTGNVRYCRSRLQTAIDRYFQPLSPSGDGSYNPPATSQFSERHGRRSLTTFKNQTLVVERGCLWQSEAMPQAECASITMRRRGFRLEEPSAPGTRAHYPI